MNIALGIGVCSHSDSAIFLVSDLWEGFVEEVVKRSLDRVVDVLEGEDVASRDMVDNKGSDLQVVLLALLIFQKGAAIYTYSFSAYAFYCDLVIDDGDEWVSPNNQHEAPWFTVFQIFVDQLDGIHGFSFIFLWGWSDFPKVF